MNLYVETNLLIKLPLVERSYSIVLPHNKGLDVKGGGIETYLVSFPRILKSVEFPLEGCPERTKTPMRLCEHFVYQHWKAKVYIVQEGPTPLLRCDQCRIHMPAARFFNHRQVDKCNKATEKRLIQRDV